VNALFNAGAAFGAIAQGFMADKLGRKRALGIAAAFALVGGALGAGSVNVPMLIVLRLLHGFGLGMVIVLVPLYLTEVAPPHSRGLLSGLTTLSFALGYLVSVLPVRGSSSQLAYYFLAVLGYR
jgi:MFS family permease